MSIASATAPPRGAQATPSAAPVRPDEPAEPPLDPPPPPSGDHRSPRVRFANWMERTFGPAYLPLTMSVGGTAAGGAAYLAIDRLTHVRPLAVVAGIGAGLVGAAVSGALIFGD